MHTVFVIVAGLALLGAGLVIGKLVGRGRSSVVVSAAKGFIPVWFALALLNLWVGVAKAGYSLSAELPIFAVVFGVPAAVAYFAARAMSGAPDSQS